MDVALSRMEGLCVSTLDGGAQHGGLASQRDFRLLWFANGVSLAGSAITGVALPMVAIYTLDASAFDVGLLATMAWLPQLLLGLPAGIWIDRVRRRPVLIGADLARAVVLAIVPAAAVADALHLWLLYVVAAISGALTMLFDLGWTAYLPSLISRDRLVEGNSKLEATRTVVGIGGPGMGGLLVQLLTAPLALIVDVISYVVSALSLVRIRSHEPSPEAREQVGVRAQLRAGFQFLWSRPIAGVFVVSFAFAALVMTAHQALLVVFLVRTVGLPPAAIGTLLAAGGVGGFLGAVVTPVLTRRAGTARTLCLGVAFTFPFGLLIPLTRPGPGLVAYVVGAGVLAAGITSANIIAFSFLLSICPGTLLGRVTSVARVLQTAGGVLGGLLGGTVGGWIGVRAGIWITVAAMVGVAAIIVASPIRRLRDLPQATGRPSY